MGFAIVDREARRKGILPINVLGVGKTVDEAYFDAEDRGHDMFNVDRVNAQPIKLETGRFYHYRRIFGKPKRHGVNDGFTSK